MHRRPSRTRACSLAAALVCTTTTAAATEAVVVSATRTPIEVSDAVADVSVLDRAALDRTEARTLAEVLAQLPGLQASANGGLGKPSFLYLRGLEARHVLLLVDGVRVGSATLNTPSLDNLPLDAIERIEVVRGPLTSRYGSGAMGGVVQVFTRRAAAGIRANARAAGGSRGYVLGSAGAGHARGGVDLAVQVQGQRTDGFSATNPNAPFGAHDPDADGFRQNGASVRAGWAFAPRWRLEAQWLEARGTTHYDDGPGADARADLHTRVASLQAGGPVVDGWSTRLLVGESTDGYDTVASASPWTELGLIRTRQRQATWDHRVRLPLGEALLAAERVEQRVRKPGAPFDVDRRRIDALVAGWTVHQGPHDLQASLRHDDDSQFGGQTTGALAYARAFARGWRAGGSWGTSFTAPSFNQLYYPGFGNPDLRPEDGDHGELFVQWGTDMQQLRATAYRHRYRSFISAGPTATNLPRVAIDGVTLGWDARLDAWRLSASLDWVDPRNDTAGSPHEGRLLPRRAQRMAKAGADWTQGAWTAGGALQAYSSRFDDVANTVRLGGYGVVDVHADWRFAPDWQLGVRLNNVAAKAYETAYGYRQAGREAYVTLRWAPR